jgi:hypothetical protein
VEDGLDLVAHVVAAHPSALLELGLLVEQRLEACRVRLGSASRDAPVEGLRRLEVGGQPLGGRLPHRERRVDLGLLGEVAHPQVALHRPLAAVVRLDAREDPQEGRLPAPVGAQEPDALPLLDGEGDVLEHDDVAVHLADVFEGYEGHGAGILP